MANIRETISEVEKLNPELARQLKKYVKDHSYGLVFEHNLPEAVRLYTKTPVVGDTVNILPDRGKEERTENVIPWVVKYIDGDDAVIEHKGETKAVSVGDIVTLVSYRDVIYPGLREIDRIERGSPNDPYHMVINSENYHALEALAYCYPGKVDCIYIDPPYNTGAKDWKYNNDYVDSNDRYRHSKWLAFMERRLKLARQLLNPKGSVLIVTIDEKEYLRLGLLLEQMFPEAKIQMVSSVISHHGTSRLNEFSRVNEFIYFVMIGEYSLTPIDKSGYVVKGEKVHWQSYRRSNPTNVRASRPSQFYPIYINKSTKRIVEVGEPITPDVDRFSVKQLANCETVFPVRDDGTEMMWSLLPEVCRERVSNGYLRVGKYTPNKPQQFVIQYLMSGTIKAIENGSISVVGYEKDGSVIAQNNITKLSLPKTQWDYSSHDARDCGTKILKSIVGEGRFDFPKSVYAVKDCIKLFTGNKSDALIVDFFAGSGTTLHAVNLLNAEDEGHRRCICVTNNEVSADEVKEFTAKGLRQGDPEWEEHGIARYVTWPRTKCSIEGVDIKGNPLEGNYLGSGIPMADGFKANVIFCELTYESAWPIRLDRAFNAIAPILWMQAGCKGPIIRRIGKSYLTTDYYGVLFDYNQASKFCDKVKNTPTIKTVYVVTDDQRRYSNMCKRLPNIEVHRLYETYLRTFEICGEGGID
jgi:adenine-specific DNA-methyltransferase